MPHDSLFFFFTHNAPQGSPVVLSVCPCVWSADETQRREIGVKQVGLESKDGTSGILFLFFSNNLLFFFFQTAGFSFCPETSDVWFRHRSTEEEAGGRVWRYPRLKCWASLRETESVQILVAVTPRPPPYKSMALYAKTKYFKQMPVTLSHKNPFPALFHAVNVRICATSVPLSLPFVPFSTFSKESFHYFHSLTDKKHFPSSPTYFKEILSQN